MPERVAVIIPYYQNEPRSLRRAIGSVLEQRLPEGVGVDVVVVDDESPSPAEDSLRDIVFEEPFRLRLLKKPNGGPGSARNFGLDALDPLEVAYVAFLDSDDEWIGDHLHEAIEGIKAGADLWFANSFDGDGGTSFYYQEYLTSRHSVDATSEPETGSLLGRNAFREFHKSCMPHTSTVVYDFRKHSQVRFESDLRLAGEDHFFWLSIADRAEEIAYTTACRGRRGKGVSIYRSNQGWDTPHVIDLSMYKCLFHRKVERKFALTDEERDFNRSEEKVPQGPNRFPCDEKHR